MRGLAGTLRTRRFVKGDRVSSSLRFRQNLRNLLLEARVALHPLHFDRFLEWSSDFLAAQIPEFATLTVGYEHLSGVYERAPAARLETELRWITSRLRVASTALNYFRTAVSVIEGLAFSGKYEEAIIALQVLEQTQGASFWSVQLRVALEHHAGGLERQKQYSGKTRSVYGRGLLPFITYYTSVRNEDRTTVAKYREDVRNRIEKHRYFTDSTKSYVRFRLLSSFPNPSRGLATFSA